MDALRLALPAVAALALLGGTARAETEQAVSVGLGWATFSTVGKAMGNMQPPALSSTCGGSLGVIYERAVGTDLMLRGELVGGLFYGGTDPKQPDQSKTSGAVLGDAGVALRFDVMQYVPYAFAGLGAVTSGGGPIAAGTDFVLVIGGGLDWLRGRERSYGVEARLASFGGDITVFTIGVRGTTRWGFF
jgi:hypothetical protein